MKTRIEMKQELNQVIDEMFDILEDTNEIYKPLTENFESYVEFVDNLVSKKYGHAEALNKGRALLRKSKVLAKSHEEEEL